MCGFEGGSEEILSFAANGWEISSVARTGNYALYLGAASSCYVDFLLVSPIGEGYFRSGAGFVSIFFKYCFAQEKIFGRQKGHQFHGKVAECYSRSRKTF